jgi:hypothetical protein
MKEEKTKTISLEKYHQLLDRSNKLMALEECGVDNWDGYADAMKVLKTWEDEVFEGDET